MDVDDGRVSQSGFGLQPGPSQLRLRLCRLAVGAYVAGFLDYLLQPLLPAHGPSESVKRLWDEAHGKESTTDEPAGPPAY